MIDLHSHTNESDGTCTPLELVDRALSTGLEALAITDHDTFAGYDRAAQSARAYGLDLVCGIELNARSDGERRRPVHVLGYFLQAPPTPEFRAWLAEMQSSRRERNSRLIAKLQAMGVDIELAEVERLGRTLTGRPHFARVLVNKGYATDHEDAFRRYVGEAAPSFVERHGPHVATTAQKIREAGGLAVWAHPIRLGIRDATAEEQFIRKLCDSGIGGIEVYHSDHGPQDVARYAALAAKYNLAVTGGSDFHGDIKPDIELGTGRQENLDIPNSVLENLRRRS